MMFLNDYPIKNLGIDSKCYPKKLKEIPDAPKTLYLRGNLLPAEQCFAIVGTRRASDYGKEVAFRFGYELARAGLTVVSGMALGVDTFSHKGSLEAGGRTIAVLGTGLDEKTIYPQENLGLAKKILEQGGCLLSEYPCEYPGALFTFPQRNRIIAGLSLGVLVVEAKLGSGALITADWAKRQGKKVFSVPGPIHSSNSRGCHLLIRQGAILTEKLEDILKELGIETFLNFSAKNLKEKGGQNETENKILEILKNGGLHIDKIIEKTNLPAQTISAALSLMEIEGKVKNLGGNIYGSLIF